MDLWVKLDKFWRENKYLFVFKGYTCRFKSEAIASFASIALRPCMGTMLLFNCETVIYIYLLKENILKKPNNISVLHYDSFLVSIVTYNQSFVVVLSYQISL